MHNIKFEVYVLLLSFISVKTLKKCIDDKRQSFILLILSVNENDSFNDTSTLSLLESTFKSNDSKSIVICRNGLQPTKKNKTNVGILVVCKKYKLDYWDKL